MDRRHFLQVIGSAGAAAAVSCVTPRSYQLPTPTASALPRWRGFNLLEKFTDEQNQRYRESDFATIASWGFNFVRLPMSYRCWTDADPARWTQMDGKVLKEVDEAVRFGHTYGIHVNLNLHRAPGYCVNPPAEPLDLWTDDRALDAFCFQWRRLAERYRSVPSRDLSFDLVNEPAKIDEATYARVVRRAVEAIRGVSPDRLVVADGLDWGNTPVPSLADLHIAQSTRGYQPMAVSHYKASWVENSDQHKPSWPFSDGKETWEKDRLLRQQIEPWKALQHKGVGVHVGEWGVYRYTPHDVALAWMRDCLDLWAEAGWGWSLWNLRGTFGVLDSEREDVKYENFNGHKLDRKMLELLLA